MRRFVNVNNLPLLDTNITASLTLTKTQKQFPLRKADGNNILSVETITNYKQYLNFLTFVNNKNMWHLRWFHTHFSDPKSRTLIFC